MTELGNLSPKVWGHSGWKFLFAVASIYSEEWASPETRQNYYNYFNSLKEVLPCHICREHYAEYFKNKPLAFYLENRRTLFDWLLGLHNKSNPDNMLLSSNAAIKYYLKDKPHNNETTSNRLLMSTNQNKCTNCNGKLHIS